MATIFPPGMTGAFLMNKDGSWRAEWKGATEKENEEWTKQLEAGGKTITKEMLDRAIDEQPKLAPDAITVQGAKPDDPKWAFRSMPTDCYKYNPYDDTNRGIQAQMTQSLKDYYAGNATVDDVTASFKNAFQTMRNYLVSGHFTCENDTKNTKQILLDTYNTFCQQAVSTAGAACRNEGGKIAEQYGADKNPDWVYYDSDYYNKSEAAKSAVKDCAAGLAKQLGLGDVDFPTKFEDSTRAGLYNSFNTNWNWNSTKNAGVGAMIDPDKAPPRDFKLFFKQKKYTQKDISEKGSAINPDAGVLLASSGTWKQEAEIPFRYDAGQSQRFNAASLIHALGNFCPNADEINGYLKNFDFYQKSYA